MSDIKFEYIPTSWATTTRITPERLNKIENALVQLSTVVTNISSELIQLKRELILANSSDWRDKIKADVQKDIFDMANTTLADVDLGVKNLMDTLNINAQVTLDNVKVNINQDIGNYTRSLEEKVNVLENTTAGFQFWCRDKDAADIRRDNTIAGITTADTTREERIAQLESNSITSNDATQILRNIAATENYLTSASLITAGFATKTDVDVAVQNEANNRNNAISEATNGFTTASQVKDSITRQLGTAFGMTLAEDSEIDASTLQAGLRAYTADALLTGTGLKTGEGENHSLVAELNTIKESFQTITEQINLLKSAVEELQSSSGSGSSNFGNLWTEIGGNTNLDNYIGSGTITGGVNNAFNNNNNITNP